MKLPNGDRAVVSIEKIRGYCLSFEHPRGRHKARVFQAQLGINQAGAGELRAALLEAARSSDAVVEGSHDRFGQRYFIDFSFRGSKGTATIRSAWIILANDVAPRLVTCYVI